MLAYVEATASWLLKNQSGRDQKAFTKGPSFAGLDATISVTSPDCSASGATLGPEYMAGAPEGPRIPALKRESVSSSAEIEIQEWLVISEDPDAPLPTPICRGIYMGIEPTRRSLENKDFALSDDAKPMLLKGGFYYGVNCRDVVYIPPRPLLNNGIHRYSFDVIALSEPLDKALIESEPTREQITEVIQGKVLAWGRWVGQWERNW